jgi:hypothetical protein
MKSKQAKQHERQAKLNNTHSLSVYMQGLVSKRMHNDKTIKGYKVLQNGAVKFYYKAKANQSLVKALSANTYETIKDWSVR